MKCQCSIVLICSCAPKEMEAVGGFACLTVLQKKTPRNAGFLQRLPVAVTAVRHSLQPDLSGRQLHQISHGRLQ